MTEVRQKTNWYVITGGLESGKTTTVNLLRERGYKNTIEHARNYLDTQRVDEIRKNRKEFQSGILDMQIEQEASLSPDEVVFLDRPIPDALAYYPFLNLRENEKLREAMNVVSCKKILILDPLPLINDYARTEDEVAQKRIQELLTEVYESLLLKPEERVDFIFKNL